MNSGWKAEEVLPSEFQNFLSNSSELSCSDRYSGDLKTSYLYVELQAVTQSRLNLTAKEKDAFFLQK